MFQFRWQETAFHYASATGLFRPVKPKSVRSNCRGLRKAGKAVFQLTKWTTSIVRCSHARQGAGLAAWTDEDYLLKRKLADRRGDRIQLRRAAELLFARLGPDHPNAGVRVFRVIGTERRTGPEHNVEERPRIEGNLPAVIEDAFNTVSGLLRRPSRLVGTRFRSVPEYPEFSWKEALLNAVAHRDYNIEGSGTEIWLFEDRLEIVSPGGLPGDLTLDVVLSLKRIHHSRNPRVMRTLVDLGVARDQGEGIPRMFAEMVDAFLPTPRIDTSSRSVHVTLQNTPTLTSDDRAFVAQLEAQNSAMTNSGHYCTHSDMVGSRTPI